MVNATYVEGIVCPKCGCPDLKVWQTRKVWGGKIRRVRICEHCGQRVFTTETTPKSLPDMGSNIAVQHGHDKNYKMGT